MDLIPFFLTVLVLELTPGPNMTYLVLVSSTHGYRAGLSMTAGIALGLLVLGMAAGLGAAAILTTYPWVSHTI
jgi:threonine/homoserine/homoserine lactone efflux protein